jgi:7-keto-8-aminopelargonate synthetase-like enzyme
MAQSVKFEQIVKVVNEYSAIGENRGLGKLYTDNQHFDGRLINIKNKEYINFGSCSYLGLEVDQRLKDAAIEAVNKFGSYFSCSRIFVSCGNYLELEDLLHEMFGYPILLTQNTSLGHYSVMPIIIGGTDMVIYDQQAHFSMQDLSYKLSSNGTGIDVLRHNRLDELEKKVELYKEKYCKIWYVVDGVYSMFGDEAPIRDIVKLLDKHKKLYLYVDDAHGMSWAGPNGTGHVMNQSNMHPKMILGTSLAKGFGSRGGVFVFQDVALREKVRHWGGPLSHSGPQEPATIAASIASAKIHLTNEIYHLQNKLQNRIRYANEMMSHYKVPLVSLSHSGIFFVGCGLPRVGFNMVERLLNEGFYTNIGIFPAVPETCTGVRFTMTNHITYHDIERLAKAFAKHLPEALREEGRSMQDIYKAFRKFTDFESRLGPAVTVNPADFSVNGNDGLVFDVFPSVKSIKKEEWNKMFIDRGCFDYESLLLLENTFTANPEKENNWKFYYYIIRHNGVPVVATFFTSSLVKDDMLAPEQISAKIEKSRKADPYYLTSVYFSMGTQLTFGDHLFVDKRSPHWKKAMTLLLDEIWKEQEKENAPVLLLRDFEVDDPELTSFFIDNGFVKMDMGVSGTIENLKNISFETYYQERLNKKKRLAFRNIVKSREHLFKVEVNNYNADDLKHFYELYLSLKQNNLKVNSFIIPYKFFELVDVNKHWEILTLRLVENGKIASVILSAFNEDNYHPMIIGIDYSLDESLNIYKQSLYRLILRSLELNVNTLHLGLTAVDAKYNLGATKKQYIAFIQQKDTYNQDLIESMAFGE